MYYVSVVSGTKLEDLKEFSNEQDAHNYCDEMKNQGLNVVVNETF
jgi:hypothetical protein